jgi:Virulence factor BrkB
VGSVFTGGLIAVVLWLIASALFALYVASFGHYNKVYGSLAGVIIFLIWMWISNVACGCRKPCRAMRPGHTRGSGRRGDPAVEPGRLCLGQVDAGVRQAGSVAAPGEGDADRSDRCTRSGPAAGAAHP